MNIKKQETEEQQIGHYRSAVLMMIATYNFSVLLGTKITPRMEELHQTNLQVMEELDKEEPSLQAIKQIMGNQTLKHRQN